MALLIAFYGFDVKDTHTDTHIRGKLSFTEPLFERNDILPSNTETMTLILW